MGKTEEKLTADGQTKHICLGLLAHVDAGKTTLSESLLYLTGAIRHLGRVDHQDTFLDTDTMEKERGITIFSKQAEFETEHLKVTLVDTPGHADFSPEMERTLQVLDAAVLIISAADGVTGQVKTLWKLLSVYQIPVLVFVNKMDQSGADRGKLFAEIQRELSQNAVDFGAGLADDEVQENVAVCDEVLLEAFLEEQKVTRLQAKKLFCERKIFPVLFGSALKTEGVREMISLLEDFAPDKHYPAEFGARVFKVSRDEKGNRLTWLKVTGGTLAVKSVIHLHGDASDQGEKVDQIRIYAGKSFRMVQTLEAGWIGAVTGLERSRIGDGYGAEPGGREELLQPVFSAEVLFREDENRAAALQKLRILEEEEPELHVRAEENSGRVFVQVMGEVQLEILQRILEERFQLKVSFGDGQIIYRETIAEPAEGVGHYEPLRHYAEVHLLLEPGPKGSGMNFASSCSTDDLDRNWQRLILTHLEEKKHVGVLIGAELTDMKITLLGGRAHKKHTEGGDFRQATYRAVRQGLMQTKSILLEPVYRFQADIPAGNLGRLLSDLQRMSGNTDQQDIQDGRAHVSGTVPAAAFGKYQEEMTAYTHGDGRIQVSPEGYAPCGNAEEVILESGYDPNADTENPSGSIFCSHGAGTFVPWDQVKSYMHVETEWQKEHPSADDGEYADAGYTAGWREEKKREKSFRMREQEYAAGEEELKAIFERTYGAIRKRTAPEPEFYPVMDGRERTKKELYPGKKTSLSAGKAEKRERYLLVDGYNVIFAWEELHSLADRNIDAARDKLIDVLSDYQGYLGGTLILVFDAYKVSGGKSEVYRYHNIYVVYTREAETADAYIEKTVHEIGRKHEVTVATSDRLEQMIILGEGARRMSARELAEEIHLSRKEMGSPYLDRNLSAGNYLLDHASPELRRELEEIRKKEDGKRQD